MVSENHHQPEPGISAANECYTNAYPCCLGIKFLVLEYTKSTAYVYAYDKEIAPLNNVPIVSKATSRDDLVKGHTYSIIINKALYYGIK